MCLIVDACVSHEVFGQRSPRTDKIWEWLQKDGRLACGGRLLTELQHSRNGLRLLAELRRQSKLQTARQDQVDAEETLIRALPALRSNDPHVLAVARLTGARTLFTSDGQLMDDFRDRDLVSPPGRIFSKHTQTSLLSHTPGCPGYVPKKLKQQAAKRRAAKT